MNIKEVAEITDVLYVVYVYEGGSPCSMESCRGSV